MDWVCVCLCQMQGHLDLLTKTLNEFEFIQYHFVHCLHIPMSPEIIKSFQFIKIRFTRKAIKYPQQTSRNVKLKTQNISVSRINESRNVKQETQTLVNQDHVAISVLNSLLLEFMNKN